MIKFVEVESSTSPPIENSKILSSIYLFYALIGSVISLEFLNPYCGYDS
jgi:hypothetical protein